ncbi:CU044_5270 family protein [Actinomadura rubrisoli]|uniref:CU044_5270 family protein n=1 Tax=Actinomadura rubrisoli TaxID=2530368 RepID=A0A4R5AWK6_9ACTN|nr:CU044_5270 family protein [Actinomadura rubrisoli]TDD76116.1 hypothetical protein E1298_31125 [Actinomadura rubrisoli]
MDDLTMVREMRSSMPGMPAETEDAIQRRLRELAAADAPAPRPVARLGAYRPARLADRLGGRRVMVRAGLPAALAAVAAAGVIVAQGSGGSEPAAPPVAGSGTGTPSGGPLPEVRLASAVELGDRAAQAAERQPYKRPGPKQWVYDRTVIAAGFDMNTWWKGIDVNKRETVENWTRVDGTAHATYFGGKLRVMDYLKPPPGDSYSQVGGKPLFHLGNYDTLPTDPDALLRHIFKSRYPTQAGATSPQSVFETMSSILKDPSPPKLRAAIYRALPKIRGVVLQRGVQDAAGRRGVAFARVDEYGERASIILDPATYRYLGSREETVRARKLYKGITTKPGTVLGWSANVDQKIVNEPGRRS